MIFALAFVASLCQVALKAVQQRHVMHAEYRKMPAISLAMAFCEVFIIAKVAHSSSSLLGLAFLALCIGSGGALGSIIGTWLHARNHP